MSVKSSRPIVRLFGSVGFETPDGSLVEAPGPIPAAVLALIATRNRAVDPMDLVAFVWGDNPPTTSSSSLRNHIARLNKAGRTAGIDACIVRTTAGYQLDRRRIEVDADLMADAMRDNVAVSVERLCSGSPLSGAAPGPEIEAIAEQLGRLASDLREQVIDDLLQQGHDTEVIRRVRNEQSRQPYNDRLAGQLMIALHRSGKSRDALQAFQQHRSVLVADLGIEPSAALVEIEASILRGEAPAAPSADAPKMPPWAALQTSDEACVGRESDLAHAADGLASNRSVLIVGEAGSGKTHLAAETLRRVAPSFAKIGVGVGDSDGESHQVWRDIAMRWATDPERRRTAEHFLSISADTSAAETHAALVLDAATQMIKDAARSGPVLIVIDDADLCDKPSFTLCRRLLASVDGVWLLLTARSVEQLTALNKQSRTIHLHPLDTSAISELAGQYLDLNEGQARRRARELESQTGGNALFVTSILRHEASNPADQNAIPPDVEAMVRQSVAGLPGATQRALEVASVIGLRFRTDLLAATLRNVDQTDISLIEPAQRAGLIVEPERGTLAFSHDILRRAVYQDTPSIRRSRIHSSLAVDLADRGGSHTTRAAWHACRSVPVTPAGHAIEIALAGADRAEKQHAFDSAQSLYAETLDIADSFGPDAFRPVALLGIARTLALGGRRAQAINALLEAELSVGARNNAELDELLVRSARVFARYLRGDPAPLDVLTRVCERVPDGAARVNAATEHMMAEFVTAGWTDAAERSAELIASSSGAGDLPQRLLSLFQTLGGPDQNTTLRLARDLLDSAGDDWWNRSFIERIGFQTEISALLWMGRLDEAHDKAAAMSDSETARGLPVLRWMAKAVDADIALTRGQFDRTRFLLDELAVSGQEWEVADAAPIHLGLLLSDSYLNRHIDPRLEALSHTTATGPASLLVAGLEGLVHVINGRLDEAAKCLQVGIDLATTEKRSNVYGGALMAIATLQTDLETDSRDARTLYNLLLPYSGTTPRFGQAGGHLGPADRVLSIMADRLNEPTESAQLATSALRQAQSMQAKPWIDRCLALERLETP